MSMKTLAMLAVTLVSAGGSLATDLAAAETVEAFSLRPMTLRDDVTPAAFEACLRGLQSLEGLIPGVTFQDMKIDRGVNKGQYAFLWVYDSIQVRDFYFPVEDESGLWDSWAQASGGLLARQSEEVGKYLKPGDSSGYTDYVAIRPKASTRPVKLLKGRGGPAAFALWPLTLKEGVSPEVFEAFIKGMPSLENLIPGVEFRFFKGDRGVDKGKFIVLWVYDSVKVRDFYFPQDEGENPLWQAWVSASNGLLRRVVEQTSQYLAPDDPDGKTNVSDYVAVP